MTWPVESMVVHDSILSTMCLDNGCEAVVDEYAAEGEDTNGGDVDEDEAVNGGGVAAIAVCWNRRDAL